MRKNKKIKTNKFKVIKISRLKEGTIWIRRQRIWYSKEGTILRLRFSTNGYATYVYYRNKIACKRLQTLYLFCNLSLK